MRFLKNKIARAQGKANSPQTMNIKYEEIPCKAENKVEYEESFQTRSTADQDLIKTEDYEYSFSDNRLKYSQSVQEQSPVKMEKIEEMLSESSDNSLFRSSSVPVGSSSIKEIDSLGNMIFENQKQEDQGSDKKPKEIKSAKAKLDTKNKNFIKNVDLTYFKAILTFINSHIALPYVKNFIQQENIKFTEFTSFIGQCQESASNGLQAFRQILLINETTDKRMISLKIIFKALAEIFVREHSINWIQQSRLTYKEEYINYRLKMLKKIQNPVKYLNLRGKDSNNK